MFQHGVERLAHNRFAEALLLTKCEARELRGGVGVLMVTPRLNIPAIRWQASESTDTDATSFLL